MIKKLLPLLLIIFIWFIFSKPFFIEGKIPFPADLALNQYNLWSSYDNYWSPIKNPSQPDIIDQIYPWKKLTIDSIKKFEIPYWNPYSFSGTPHLANYQSSTFSITNLFYYFFSFNKAWALAVLTQPLLAGIFTYLFVRSLRRSKVASLISAISFMFSGFLTVWMGYTTLGLAISFLPLGFYAIEKYTHNHKIYYLILLSLVFPLSFFSGHFQTSIYLSLFLFAYILFKYLDNKNKKDLTYLGSFSFLGILLSMPQILPSIEFYFSTIRSTVFQKIESVPIKYLITNISPDYYGNPVTRNNYFGNYIEWASFTGTITFLLALFSLFKTNKYTFFFLFSAVLALLFSLDTFLTDLLVRFRIPVLSTSALSRILVIFSFSISVLAAFGIDFIFEDANKKKKEAIIKWFILCISILGLVWLLTIGKIIDPQNYQIAIKNLILPTILALSLFLLVALTFVKKGLIKFILIIILILVAFDMLRFSTKWQVFSEQNLVFPESPIISKLKTLDNTYRTYGKFGAEGAVFYEFPGTEGYDPLYINRYGELIASIENGELKSSPRSGVSFDVNAKYAPKIFDMLGLKYVLEKRLDEDEVWGFPFTKYSNKFEAIHKEKDFTIFENKEVLPRAFLVGDYEVITGDQKILTKLFNQETNLERIVILETDPKINKTNEVIGTVDIIDYQPNSIILRSDSNTDSILVLTDNYYPGWKAKINSKDAKILRANYTFKAIAIPKGENIIEFYYNSKTLKNGALLALIGISMIIIFTLTTWYTKLKKNNHESRSELKNG